MVSAISPILLVEDDPSLRDSLGQFLHDHGYRTVVARTAREGREMLRTARPWLCLLDLNLPDGSGLDLLKRLIQQRIDIRVVVMTAFDLQRLRPADMAGVLVGWLTKPVNPVDLLAIVMAEDQRRRSAAAAAQPEGQGHTI